MRKSSLWLALLGLIPLLLIATPGCAQNPFSYRYAGAVPPPPISSTIMPGTTPYGTWAEDDPSLLPHYGNPTDYGYYSNPVAQWTNVQFPDITSVTPLCVQSYHVADGPTDGTRSVQMKANGGALVDAVYGPTADPWGGHGWCASLDPATGSGALEVRAIVCPWTGPCLELQGLTQDIDRIGSLNSIASYTANLGLVANASTTWVAQSGGSDANACTQIAPCATLDKARNQVAVNQGVNSVTVGGGTINLAGCGNYTLGTPTENTTYIAATRWLTVQGAPGQPASCAVINATGDSSGIGIRTQKVHFANLTTTLGGGGRPAITGTAFYFWFDHIIANASAQFDIASGLYAGAPGGIFITDSDYSHYVSGPQSAVIVANLTIHDLGGDALSNSLFMENVSLSRMSSLYTPFGNTMQIPVTYTMGSNVGTGVPDTSLMYAGAVIADTTDNTVICIPHSPATTITSVSAHSFTMSANALCSETTSPITPNHGDNYQAQESFTSVTYTYGSATVALNTGTVGSKTGGLYAPWNDDAVVPLNTYITRIIDATHVVLSSPAITAGCANTLYGLSCRSCPTTCVNAAAAVVRPHNVILNNVQALADNWAQGFFSDGTSAVKDTVVVNSNFTNNNLPVPPTFFFYLSQGFGRGGANNLLFKDDIWNGQLWWRQITGNPVTPVGMVVKDFHVVNNICSSAIQDKNTAPSVVYTGGTC